MKEWQQTYTAEQTALEITDPGRITATPPLPLCNHGAQRCTRPRGHDGPHCRTDRHGVVVARWSDNPTERKSAP